VALLVLGSVFATGALANANTQAEVTLRVNQAFTNHGTAAAPNETFTYRLTPRQAGNPMPAGSSAESFTFAMQGNVSGPIGTIVFNQAGSYSYTIEHITSIALGYTFDRERYTVDIYIDQGMRSTMVLRRQSGVKVENISYSHSYRWIAPPPTTIPGTTTTAASTSTTTRTPTTTAAATTTTTAATSTTARTTRTTTTTRPGGVTGPKTSDDSNPMLYIVLLGFGAVVALGAVSYLIILKKRQTGRDNSTK